MTTIIQKEWLANRSETNDFQSDEEAKHAHRVAKFCLKIAQHLNLFHDDMDTVYQAALIHDLPNVSVFGHMMNLGEQADVIKYKDEWYDGSGEEGLEKGAIPVLSRVLAIANFYDRVIFKYGLTKSTALDELQRLSGKRFDPMMIPVALKALEGKQ